MGLQFLRPEDRSRLGDHASAREMLARVLSFSVPREPKVLTLALEAIRDARSYGEPVNNIIDTWASRAVFGGGRDNPNWWWNRGIDH